jgi:hypothetical protein
LKTQTAPRSSAKSQSKHKGLKIAGIALAAIVGFILIGWGFLEHSYQQRIGALKSEAQMVGQDAIKPIGETVGSMYVQCPHWLDTTGASDVVCPEVQTSWSVLVNPGGEFDLMNGILQKEGYSVRGISGYVSAGPGKFYGGTKGKFILELSMSSLSGPEPYSAPVGKEWRSLGLQVHEQTK